MELKIYDSNIKLSDTNWTEILSKYDIIKGTSMNVSRYFNTVHCRDKDECVYKFKGIQINKAVGLSLPEKQVYYCKVKDLNGFTRKRKIENLLK